MRLDRTAFTLDGEPVTLGEVVAWAFVCDLGAPSRARLADKCASESSAEERDLELDDDVVQRAANAWRVKRGLTTAAATRARFDEVGVTFDDLGAYVTRTLWLDRDPTQARGEADAALFAEELFFEGRLDELARACATRAVAPASEADDTVAVLEARGWTTMDDAIRVLEGLGVTAELARRVVEREGRWRGQRPSIVSDADVDKAITDRRDELRKIVVTAALAWSRDCARELYLCVRDDGAALDLAATNAGLETTSEEWLAADLGGSLLGARILGAPVGHALLPEEAGPLIVRQIKRRIEASSRDPIVREYVAGRLVEERLASEVGRRVTFLGEAR